MAFVFSSIGVRTHTFTVDGIFRWHIDKEKTMPLELCAKFDDGDNDDHDDDDEKGQAKSNYEVK